MRLAKLRGKSELLHSLLDGPAFQEFVFHFLSCRCNHCVIQLTNL